MTARWLMALGICLSTAVASQASPSDPCIENSTTGYWVRERVEFRVPAHAAPVKVVFTRRRDGAVFVRSVAVGERGTSFRFNSPGPFEIRVEDGDPCESVLVEVEPERPWWESRRFKASARMTGLEDYRGMAAIFHHRAGIAFSGGISDGRGVGSVEYRYRATRGVFGAGVDVRYQGRGAQGDAKEWRWLPTAEIFMELPPILGRGLRIGAAGAWDSKANNNPLRVWQWIRIVGEVDLQRGKR